MARNVDTSEHVCRMQQELLEVLAQARSKGELMRTDMKDLAIHRRLSRVNYSRRCAEASAVKAYQEQGLPLVP
jgi:hypothetical protein